MIFKNNNGLSFSLFGSVEKIKKVTGNFGDIKKALSWFNFEKSIGSTDAQALLNKNIKNTTSSLQEYLKSLNGAKASLGGYTKHLINTNLKTKALELGTKALKFAIDTVAMIGLSWAISSIANAIQEYQANLEKARQETIEAGKVADETNDKLQEYIATYHRLAETGGDADQLKDLQQQIADLVGVQADNLDLVNGKLDDELEKLRQISIEQAQKNKGDLTGALVSAEQDLESAKGSGVYSGYSHRFFKIDDSLLSDSGFMSLLDSLGVAQKYSNTGEFTGSFTFAQDSAENLYKSYQACVQAVTYMKDNMEPELLKESALYNDLTAQIGKYSEAAKAYGDALNAYNQNEAIIAVGENLKTFSGEINDQTSFNNWVNGIIDAEGATGDYADAIWEVCGSRYPQFARESDKVSNELNKVEDAAKGTSTEIKSLSNSLSEIEKISDKFSKLGSAISELKEDGYVSIKTINEIAEAFKGTEGLDEYISQIATASNTSQLQNSIQGLINSYLNQESVLKGLDNANKQVLITQLKRLGVANAEEIINAKINQNLPGLTQNMKDFSKMTTNEATSLYALAKGANIASSELKKYAQIVEKVNEIERLEAEAKKSKAYDSHIYAWRINNIRKDIANIVDSINVSNMDTDVKIKISMSGLEDLSGSGKNGEATNETAEKKIKNLKHQHEMGLISEKEYYEKLEKIRKQYYAGKSKYLDRDRALQEEYHDWEVKNAEDGFEKKVEELQKKYVNGKLTYSQLKSAIKKLINTTFKKDKDTKNEYIKKIPDYLKDAVDDKTDKNKDSFEKEVEELQKKYVDGKISYDKLRSDITSKINTTFKDDKDTKNEYLDKLSDYLKDAVESKEEKNREDFDLSYDKLKYQLENGFITEATYYKNLDALYKKHYGNKTKYLDEYSQYSQEVYDGFKDMYKKDLEADKKALEEKKKAITEYYDELIEKIQDTHDEEDYEKEQSKKRKEIFDIDMQIAELMRDGSEKAKARIAELEEERLKAEEEYRDFETDKARKDEIERLEKEREARDKEVQEKIDSIDTKLDSLDTNTKDIRNAVIQYAKAKGVDIKFAYASGTRSSVGGFGRINEKGIEMIASPDGNGNYVNLMPGSYVFSAKATEFLWKLATEHSLPQAMYNSIAKSIKTQSSTPSVNIAQPITITMGDIIIKGNADKQTVADIKKEQENTVRMVLQKIKELQK